MPRVARELIRLLLIGALLAYAVDYTPVDRVVAALVRPAAVVSDTWVVDARTSVLANTLPVVHELPVSLRYR